MRGRTNLVGKIRRLVLERRDEEVARGHDRRLACEEPLLLCTAVGSDVLLDEALVVETLDVGQCLNALGAVQQVLARRVDPLAANTEEVVGERGTDVIAGGHEAHRSHLGICGLQRLECCRELIEGGRRRCDASLLGER